MEAEAPRVLNKLLLRRVVAQIKTTPDEWDQTAWIKHNCKTKRCIAGWTLFLEGITDEVGTPTAKGWRFFKSHGLTGQIILYGIDEDNGLPDWSLPYQEAGAILLGLSDDAAFKLFDGDSSSCVLPKVKGHAKYVQNDFKTMLALITELTGMKDFRIRKPKVKV